MACKLKLHSKEFYLQILVAITVLKFLQMLALDFPYICLFICLHMSIYLSLRNFSWQEEKFLWTNMFEKMVLALAHVAA